MNTNNKYIKLVDVCKSYRLTNKTWYRVLKNINLTVNFGEKIGIIGVNGAGKSTLIRIIGGVSRPDRGEVYRNMSVSFPLAFTGGFQESLTGLDNLKFICRVYNRSWQDKIHFVEDFAELGRFFYEPVKTYSSGMRARLGFAISLVVEFDCYLIDEVMAVGDSRFHKKCYEELFVKRQNRSFVMVSHDYGRLKSFCNRFAVLHNGQIYDFHNNFEEARNFYEKQKQN